MKKAVYAVIGGDERYLLAANYLSSLGDHVRIFGFDSGAIVDQSVTVSDFLFSAIHGADYIILPLPCSIEKGLIHTPLYKDSISLDALFCHIKPNQIVFGGKLDTSFCAALAEKNIICHDYAEREEFSILNAIPTAEGAIEIAIRELPFTLHGSNCLVIGYGRIAKVLCHSLAGLGAQVSAAARKESDRTWMQTFGYKPIHTKDLTEHISQFQVIINTVPQVLLTRDVLRQIKQDALIIDLASRPGGVDFESAKELGLKVIWALSLPGKVAPQSAANIICKAIFNIIDESEVNA